MGLPSHAHDTPRNASSGEKTPEPVPESRREDGGMKNNIGLFLAKRAHLNPRLEAFIDTHSGRRLTFAELDARANRIANHLSRELGVRKGDRVGLLLMNSPEFMESFFAIAKLGAVCVPLNWRLVPDELQFILKDSRTTVLIYGGRFRGDVRGVS